MSGGVPSGGFAPPASQSSGPKVQHVQAGMWWPAADPGKLRAAAQAWRQLASDVDSVASSASSVVSQVVAENQGQGVTAFESYWSVKWAGGSGCLPAVAQGARALAGALDRYAQAVENAQNRVKELIAAAATAAIVGIGLTILTVGISDVAAGAVAGGLVAAAAAVGADLSIEAAGIITAGLFLTTFGALDGGLTDLAIQEERVQIFHDQASINWNEVLNYSEVGAATAAVTFGAGTALESAGPTLSRIFARLGGSAAEQAAAEEATAAEANLTLSAEQSWGNRATLERHFRDHGADFGATSPEDYAQQASQFLQRAQRDGLPTKIDQDGVIRVYDPSTNTFGAYNPDGTARTFFKPTSPTYWDRQPGVNPWTP